MKKTLFVTLTVLMILNACAAPPTPTEVVNPPTKTPIPTSTPTKIPTSTPLPPTPALDGLLLSDETLSTKDGVPLYILNNSSWDAIPPEALSKELAALEGWHYSRREEGELQIIDFDGNLLWTKTGKIWTELPKNLPDGWQFLDEENIADKDGVIQYKLDTKTIAWLSVTKESLEAAQKYNDAVVEIIQHGDTAYALDIANNLLATFNPETGEWGPNNYTTEQLEALGTPYYSPDVRGYSQHLIVESVTMLGDIGNGAEEILDKDNNPTGIYVLAKATVLYNVQGNTKITEVPLIMVREDNGYTVAGDQGFRGAGIDLEDGLIVIASMFYTRSTEEEKTLYQNDEGVYDREDTEHRPTIGPGDILITYFFDKYTTPNELGLARANEVLGSLATRLPEDLESYKQTGDLEPISLHKLEGSELPLSVSGGIQFYIDSE